MRSDPVDLLVAFVLGGIFAAMLIVAWAYDSARRRGTLPEDGEEDEEDM